MYIQFIPNNKSFNLWEMFIYNNFNIYHFAQFSRAAFIFKLDIMEKYKILIISVLFSQKGVYFD